MTEASRVVSHGTPGGTRPHHSHIGQTRDRVTGCPACRLIRPEVMRARPHMIGAGMFGRPLTPDQ